MTDDPFPTPGIGSAALAFSRAVRQRHGAALAELGLHPGQDLLLLEVWRHPGSRIGTLALHLGVEPPTVTRMVARLERGGLLERRADPDDGRALLVVPTQRSRLLEAGVRRAWAALEEAVAAALPSGEVERFAEQLALVARGLRPPAR